MYFSFDLRALVASEKEHSVAGHKAVTVWSLEKSSSERVRIALSCNQGQNLRLAGEEAVTRANKTPDQYCRLPNRWELHHGPTQRLTAIS